VTRIESIPPDRAHALLGEGYAYLDVRTEEEFLSGRPAGAYCVPLMQAVGGRLVDNADFLSVVSALFDKQTPLVVGCQAGARSLRAVQLLASAGFERVINMSGGWGGGRDAFGRRVSGWQELGLEAESGPGTERTYAALVRRSLGDER
jgi:rhodanese-related sulfurtransferase